MFDSRSVSVRRRLEKCAGETPPPPAPTAAPSDAERVFQCQGDESLAAQLIISITHGRVAQTSPRPLLPPLHAHTRWASNASANQFGSGLLSGLGGTCWEVGTVEERWRKWQQWRRVQGVKSGFLLFVGHLQAKLTRGIALIPIQLLEVDWARTSLRTWRHKRSTIPYFFFLVCFPMCGRWSIKFTPSSFGVE